MTAVIVCCDYEWRATLPLFPDAQVEHAPPGDFFFHGGVLFFRAGWGKIAAAASAQYVIDRWRPSLLINLGTCGGFPGEAARGEILLAERTIVYDIVEQMTDPEAAIRHYTTEIDLAWLAAPPQPVRRGVLVSADRDLIAREVPSLKARYGAIAGDWESGAIAWVAARNGVRCLILRGVSDLVGEAYEGNFQLYVDGAAAVMRNLVEHLPAWIGACR